MRRLTLPIPALAALVAAGPAAATPAVGVAVPSDGVRYGEAVDVAGRVLDGAAPAAGEQVVLQVRAYPYTGAWKAAGAATTGADGTFAFTPALPRNADVRVVHPAGGAISAPARVYVYPARLLTFKEQGPDTIRLRQRYSVPRGVRLRAPTRFYVGPRDATSAIQRAKAKTRRLGPGRYEATAVVELPARFGGRFRYASCFGYSRGSGMGKPAQGCPRRYSFG